jgi:hypothetical protein
MLRVCVTSRPNSRIEAHFLPKTDIDDISAHGEDCSTKSISHMTSIGKTCVSRVLISEDQVSSDLREYIMIKVKQCPKLKAWLSKSDTDMLCARAEGMFLWYA